MTGSPKPLRPGEKGPGGQSLGSRRESGAVVGGSDGSRVDLAGAQWWGGRGRGPASQGIVLDKF